MSKIKRALGLMSGTSMDGIDLALIETDGESHVRRLGSATLAYDANFRASLREALAAAATMTERTQRPGRLASIERELTERHAAAATKFLGDRMLQPSAVDVIAFHGQTVLHRPDKRLTVQIGDGALLARRTGVDVVYDLRAADVAEGGQGAPLVPVYHAALAAKLRERPVAFLNIGGVANLTWVGADGSLVAFDTGPGNALIDDWMLQHTGEARDVDGKTAAAGSVNSRVVHAYLMHPFFAKPVPKSLDRNAFPLDYAEGLSLADGAATLAAVTVEAVAKAREHVPAEPALWIVCGGGRRNRTLMSMLAARVENAVVPAEAVGFDGDTLEAEAWAYLAVRSLMGLPITYPATTGVQRALTGGILARATSSESSD